MSETIEKVVKPTENTVGKTESKTSKKRTVNTKAKRKYTKCPNAVLHIIAGINNTILSLADNSGNVLTQVSAGSCGFKNCRKSTPHANNTVIKVMMERAHDVFGVRDLKVIVNGHGPARDMLMFLQNHNISIESITDITNPPYNGVRPARAKRN